ncbi:hypothetical protein [Clostridium perfringens]|uniref:hypothetical protein n=1 Tax=Clostridium perfringens TaxID=1502 RepID=UPI0024BD0E60|nr:hypothetical protein [Clostridium perfringens]MDT7931422.1 hypothetical protein [Clostridium perfringens]MDT7955365.1 hypothetical protein [Clostridium perfringens]
MNKDIELTNLIKKIAQNANLDDEVFNSYKEKFKEIYSCEYRHEYSKITEVLFQIEDSEERAFLPEKIKDIGNSIEDEYVKRRVLKLWDHINLENIRLEKLKKISEEANSAFTEVEKIKQEYSDLKKLADSVDSRIKEMNRDIDNSTSKSITILGIFSGIVMAFTGGLSFIASSLKSMNQVSIYRLVLVITLLSMAIFNIIFMLMYMIGRFTDSYIGGKCNCENRIEGCNDKKKKCVVVRYPLLIWFNVLSVIIILTLSVIYLIDRFNILTILLDYNLSLAIILVIVSAIVYLILLSLLIKRIAGIECEYEYVEPKGLLNFKNFWGASKGYYRKKDKYSDK